jgi:hypothetical protein
MSASNGGTAFPVGGLLVQESYSMTLRDYFAAKAPITVADAMVACGCSALSIGMLDTAQRLEVFGILAIMRGEYADAMLVERGTPKEPTT